MKEKGKILNMMVCAVLVATVLIVAVPKNVSAGTIIVPDEYPTIQEGLNAAGPGDTVSVQPDTYYENIIWPDTPGIQLVSMEGADLTIIDGDGNGRVITMAPGLDSTTVIDGFTIQNGIAVEGGGILCVVDCSPTITNNIIISNSADGDGGGIFCSYSSSPMITSNTFMYNSAAYGGGICSSPYSSPTISYNTITDNSADDFGGGIASYYSSPAIESNTISSNSASGGAGVACYSSSTTITNNEITTNFADMGGGILCAYDSVAMIYNNEITGNEASYAGAGISLAYGDYSSVTQNTITDNSAGGFGGGITCAFNSESALDDNTIKSNSAVHGGGGIDCSFYSSPEVTGNTIMDNSATEFGGGIFVFNYSSPTIVDNEISGNSADIGGGVSCGYDSSPTIDHNTINGNSVTTTGGGIACAFGSSPTIIYNTISSNSVVDVPLAGGISCHYSSPVINYCDIFDNGGYGVQNTDQTVFVDAQYNWWGDPSGPSGYGSGTGDEVSEGVDYEPWSTHPWNLPATIDINQETLNIKSKGKWANCFIELPEGYDVDVYDIVISTIKITDINGMTVDISAKSHPTAVGDYDNDGILDLMVKFDKSEIKEYVSPGYATITVSGRLDDGTFFEGQDTIRVIKPGK